MHSNKSISSLNCNFGVTIIQMVDWALRLMGFAFCVNELCPFICFRGKCLM